MNGSPPKELDYRLQAEGARRALLELVTSAERNVASAERALGCAYADRPDGDHTLARKHVERARAERDAYKRALDAALPYLLGQCPYVPEPRS